MYDCDPGGLLVDCVICCCNSGRCDPERKMAKWRIDHRYSNLEYLWVDRLNSIQSLIERHNACVLLVQR